MTSLKGDLPTIGLRISPIHLLLLVQLDGSSKYGYEMLKSMKEAFNGIWEPKTGTVYPALKSLEKQGLVSMTEKEGVDFYNITEKGRDLLKLLGRQQATNLRYAGRFLATLSKWMSPELKKDVLLSVVNATQENGYPFGGIINLLDEDVDPETKLRVLRSLRKNLAKQTETIDSIIVKLEASSA